MNTKIRNIVIVIILILVAGFAGYSIGRGGLSNGQASVFGITSKQALSNIATVNGNEPTDDISVNSNAQTWCVISQYSEGVWYFSYVPCNHFSIQSSNNIPITKISNSTVSNPASTVWVNENGKCFVWNQNDSGQWVITFSYYGPCATAIQHFFPQIPSSLIKNAMSKLEILNTSGVIPSSK